MTATIIKATPNDPTTAAATRNRRGTASTQAVPTAAITVTDPEAKLSSPWYRRPTRGLITN